MIGRGSRRLKDKGHFNIIDLGDNARRLGLWQEYIDWNEIFINPWKYIEYLKEENKILRSRIPGQIHTQRDERERQRWDTQCREMLEEQHNLLASRGLSVSRIGAI